MWGGLLERNGHQSAATQQDPREVTAMWVSPRERLHWEWDARKFVGSYASSGCVLTGCA